MIFNTFETYKDAGKTLPPGSRLTFTPVGQWMGPDDGYDEHHD